jgi:hypothetical protein
MRNRVTTWQEARLIRSKPRRATLVVSFANCKWGDRTLRSNDVVIRQTYGDLLGEI